jgi:hypothetical protein
VRVTRVTIPGLRIVSEANGRDRWAKQKRAKEQRAAAYDIVQREWLGGGEIALPVVVTITRIAPGRLDSDNLAIGCKSVRDGVADAMAVDDGHPDIVWLYAQRKAGVREYGVEIAITPGRACPMCGAAQ